MPPKNADIYVDFHMFYSSTMHIAKKLIVLYDTLECAFVETAR